MKPAAVTPQGTAHPRAIRFNRAVPIGTLVRVCRPGREDYSARTLNWATHRADDQVVVDLVGGTLPVPIEYVRAPAAAEVAHAA